MSLKVSFLEGFYHYPYPSARVRQGQNLPANLAARLKYLISSAAETLHLLTKLKYPFGAVILDRQLDRVRKN